MFPLAQAHHPPIVECATLGLHEFQRYGVLLAHFDFDFLTEQHDVPSNKFLSYLFFVRGEDAEVSSSGSSAYETRCMADDNVEVRCCSCRLRQKYSCSDTFRSTGSEEVYQSARNCLIGSWHPR